METAIAVIVILLLLGVSLAILRWMYLALTSWKGERITFVIIAILLAVIAFELVTMEI